MPKPSLTNNIFVASWPWPPFHMTSPTSQNQTPLGSHEKPLKSHSAKPRAAGSSTWRSWPAQLARVDLANPIFSPLVLVTVVATFAIVGAIVATVGMFAPVFPPSSFGNLGEWVSGVAALAAVLALGHQLGLDRQRRQEEARQLAADRDNADFFRARAQVQRLALSHTKASIAELASDITESRRPDYGLWLDIATLLSRWPTHWPYTDYDEAEYLAAIAAVALRPVTHEQAQGAIVPKDYHVMKRVISLADRRRKAIDHLGRPNALKDVDRSLNLASEAGIHSYYIDQVRDGSVDLRHLRSTLCIPPEVQGALWSRVLITRFISDHFELPETPPPAISSIPVPAEVRLF